MTLTKLIKSQVGHGGKKYWKYAGFTSPIDWCGAFVWWCLKKCDEDYEYMPKSANPFYVPNIESWGKKHKRIIDKSKAKKGDIVTFDWDNNKRGNHVGFIWAYHGKGRYTTIEGNTGDPDVSESSVMMRTRYASQINKVLRLKKTSKKDAPKTTTTTTTKKETETKKIDKTYKVLPKSGMNVRQTYSKNSKRVGGITCGALFKATMKHGNWVYAPRYKGWVCIKGTNGTYLKKVD